MFHSKKYQEFAVQFGVETPRRLTPAVPALLPKKEGSQCRLAVFGSSYATCS
jgi:hypothetical protein